MTYQRKRALFIHIPELSQLGLHKVNMNLITGRRYPRHVWGDDDEVFDNQLAKWGVDKTIMDKPTLVIREMRNYIE